MTACDFNQFQLCFLAQSGGKKTGASDSLIVESTLIDGPVIESSPAQNNSTVSTSAAPKRSRTMSNKSSLDGTGKQVEEKKRKIKS
jgi:hypothetical protein